MKQPKFLFACFLAFVFTIPISQSLSVKFLMMALMVSFFAGKVPDSGWRLFKNAWDIGLYVSVLLIGLIYTEDFKTALRVLETNFSFVAIPLVVLKLGGLNKERLYDFFFTFAFGVVVASLICIVNAFSHYLVSGSFNSFYYYQLTDIIDSHPTYFAYYLILVITFFLFLSYHKDESNKIPNILVTIIPCILFIFLILTGGRTASVSILFIFSFFLLKYLLEPRTNRMTVSFVIIITMLFALFIANKYEDDNYSIVANDYWERSVLWESAIKANPNPLFGVGTGDYKRDLNKYYESHGMNEFATESYNSHNQYIQRYFSNGVIGFVALLILLGRPLLISARKQNALGVLTFFPFLIYGVTEVFFGRYQGIVFFILLHQVLIAYYLEVGDKEKLKTG